MKKLLLGMMTICLTAFSQNIRFDDETIGFDIQSSLPIETKLHNLTGSSITIDSVSIDSVTGSESIKLDELDVEIYFAKGEFSKYKGAEATTTPGTVKALESVPFTVSLCQNVAVWESNEAIKNAESFILNLTVYTSNNETNTIKVSGIWVNGGSK